MHTPSDDEPGATPLAFASAQPGEGESLARQLGALRARLRFPRKASAASPDGSSPSAVTSEPAMSSGSASSSGLAAAPQPARTGTTTDSPSAAPSVSGSNGASANGALTNGAASTGTAGNGTGTTGVGTIDAPSDGRLHPGEPDGPAPRMVPWLRRPWPTLRPGSPWARRLMLAAWPVALVAAGIGLYLCYLAASRTQPVASDGASNALQAWDMLNGNPILRGWTVTDVSFYTTELPEYVIVEWIRGLSADVLHVSAAISYTLVVLIGGLLGRGQVKGREGIVRMCIAAGIMVAPQLGPGVFILIFQPDHTGTAVPLMLTWLVLDRLPRSWYVPPIVAVMLAWGAIGDQLVLLIGVAPLALVSAIRAYQAFIQRREGWRGAWFDVSLLVAAVVAVEISRIFVKAIAAHGGYSVLPVQAGVAAVNDLSLHFWLLVQSICGLYGADLFGMSSIGLLGAIAFLHLLGLGLAGWGLWLVIRRFFSCTDRIAQILTVGILVNLAAYLLSTTPLTYWSAREVAPVLPYGAVLAARLLGARLMRARMVPALVVALACYLSALGYTASQPAVPSVSQDLADWLAANHLTYGLSSYGLGNTTTLASGATVSVRPLSWYNNTAAGGPYEFNRSWYDPRLHDANFVVLLNPPGPLDPIVDWQVKDAFGTPQHTYYVGRYIVMTYDTNLLTDLSPYLPTPPSG
jgi:hypothetical protein